MAGTLFIDRLRDASRLFEQAAGDGALIDTLSRVADATIDCLERGGRVFLCGNGGSASQATHLAGEFVGPFLDRARGALAAIPLGFDPASLTACANDFGFETAYARQLEALGRRGDILWALTTSGNSPNIIHTMRRARELGITTVLFTNHDGGRCRELADHALHTPQAATPRVQELHLALGHSLCEVVEAAMTGKASKVNKANKTNKAGKTDGEQSAKSVNPSDSLPMNQT